MEWVSKSKMGLMTLFHDPLYNTKHNVDKQFLWGMHKTSENYSQVQLPLLYFASMYFVPKITQGLSMPPQWCASTIHSSKCFCLQPIIWWGCPHSADHLPRRWEFSGVFRLAKSSAQQFQRPIAAGTYHLGHCLLNNSVYDKFCMLYMAVMWTEVATAGLHANALSVLKRPVQQSTF